MATQIAATDELLAYVEGISRPEDDVLAGLRALTAELPGGRAMQIPPAQGRFLTLLVQLIGAATVLEIGTYTGYSALCMARALPAGGRLITCDVSRKWTDIAVGFWRRAGVADRIDLRLGDARATLEQLRTAAGPGSVDLVFVDADKTGYEAYYELSVDLLRPGGLIVIDNTLFFGRVIDPTADDPDTVAIRAVNERVLADDRVDSCVLPLADGLTLARKRPV
jgi:O-methyltransferase